MQGMVLFDFKSLNLSNLAESKQLIWLNIQWQIRGHMFCLAHSCSVIHEMWQPFSIQYFPVFDIHEVACRKCSLTIDSKEEGRVFPASTFSMVNINGDIRSKIQASTTPTFAWNAPCYCCILLDSSLSFPWAKHNALFSCHGVRASAYNDKIPNNQPPLLTLWRQSHRHSAPTSQLCLFKTFLDLDSILSGPYSSAVCSQASGTGIVLGINSLFGYWCWFFDLRSVSPVFASSFFVLWHQLTYSGPSSCHLSSTLARLWHMQNEHTYCPKKTRQPL